MPHAAVYLETFGCQMNELDSELVAGSLRALGYRFVANSDAADVVLYNTCSVREHAEQKVWSRLGELALRKAREPQLVVGVLGCMAEREGEALLKRMPVVDVLVGPAELDKLPVLLDNAVRTRRALLDDEATLSLLRTPEHHKPDLHLLRSASQVALQGATSRRSSTLAAAADSLELLDLSRAISPTDFAHDHALSHADGSGQAPASGSAARSAYVRITRGCNKFCTYCVVPFTRGAEIHRPPEHIIDECKRLADAGVTEVTLLGQTVNHYRFEHDQAVTLEGLTQPQKGRVYTHQPGQYHDPYKPYKGERVTTFADLLYRIHEEVPSIRRLRFVTSFPRSFGDDVLQVIRDCPRICRYLHVPAQSGSDRLLQLMNRGYTVAEYIEFLDRARAFLHQPEIGRPLTVAGDIIVGFPTETDDDHAATAALLERARYKNCFIFKYSPRPGTIAFERLPDDVPEAVKRRRNHELLALQSRISAQVGRDFVGQTLEVFVEGLSKRASKRSAIAGARRDDLADPASGAALSANRAGRVPLTIGGRRADGAVADEHQGACSTEVPAALLPDSVGAPGTEDLPEAGDASDWLKRGADPGAPVQLSARTEGDLIVFFDVPARFARGLIGSIVPVRVTGSSTLALQGEPLSKPI